ncbi:MBOAT family O-acyltransferase [Roseobacter sp. A03A-229]
MQFVSLPWFAWMWVTVTLYWLVPRAARLYTLVALSFLFLLSISPISVALLCAFVGLCHMVGNRARVSGPVLIAAIATMVLALIWFKLGITIDSSNLAETVVIPLGLSYYTFRSVHFLMERFADRQPPCSFRDLVAYLFFLPTFVIGPIHRIDDFLRDLKRQRFDSVLLSEGAERILYGYVKISVLSNFLVQRQFGDWIAGLPEQDGALVAYLTVVQTGLNIYLQFSGHSDIAIGFARLLGFRIIENFNWPYLQTNISSFWRAWHISLSRWCRDYIYDSVVSVTRWPALGALMTMFVIGMWHEISMRYLYWGLYHGLGIVVWQYWQTVKTTWLPPVPTRYVPVTDAISILLTVHFVWLSFVIVSVPHPADAIDVYRTLLGVLF